MACNNLCNDATDCVPQGEYLAGVVAEVCTATSSLVRKRKHSQPKRLLPSREVLITVIEDLRGVLFPGYHGDTQVGPDCVSFVVGATLAKVERNLGEQIRCALCFACEENEDGNCAECEQRADRLTRQFLMELPAVSRLVTTDVKAAYEGDPAATSPDEAIFCYPGIFAVTNQRLAHVLYRLAVPLLPRIITEHAHSISGIDIHPGAQIGESFFIDHGTGVVIGETCVIGKRVRIYQGVTLGAKSFPLDPNGKPIKGMPRHPIVEDDVIIYSGATILGRITIGQGSVIGGNVWLTNSVAPGSKISQGVAASEKTLSKNGS